MAIDDNTLYGLTGAQIKELPEKVNAVKGYARELTAEDYNYPTGNPDKVALWLLEPGYYTWRMSVNVAATGTSGNINSSGFSGAVVSLKNDPYNAVTIFGFGPVQGKEYVWGVNPSTGSAVMNKQLLDNFSIMDNLTTAISGYVLSANQGKVLKDFIGDLTNLATTDKTNLVAAINEAAAGGGGGSITELTAADYNYDFGSTGSNNGLAVWLMDAGTYYLGENMNLGFATTGTTLYGAGSLLVVGEGTTHNYVIVVNNNSEMFVAETYSDGSVWNRNNILGKNNLKQITGTSQTDVMSQNAVTSMVFADPSTKKKVNIGGSGASVGGVAIGVRAFSGENNSGADSVAIGNGANTYGGSNGVAIGNGARARSENAISIGFSAGHPTTDTQYNGAISLGAYSEAHASGEMNIGSTVTSFGYNNSNYRLLTGLYDPQSAHDAATKGYVDNSLLGKQDALTAGDNITIAEESGALVISSTGGGAETFTTNEWNALWA